MKIKAAIVGVGNCASSLVQGVEYYKDVREDQFVPGLMHVNFGGYHIRDVEFVAAFDVDANKVGRDLSEAIFTPPNCTVKFSDVPKLGVEVMKGPVLDGLGKYLKVMVPVDSAQKPVEPAQVLENTKADVLISYLPVGSYEASRYYAKQAIEAGCSFVNCLPYNEFIPVKMGDSFHILPIGKLVEEIALEGDILASRPDATWYMPKKPISVISFDPITLKIGLSKVSRVLKRKGTGSVFKFSVQGGLKLTVSPDHPVLVLTKDGIVSKPAKEVMLGDYLPLAKHLPLLTENVPAEIDLIQELALQSYANDILVTGDLDEVLYPSGLSVRELADRLGVTYGQMKAYRHRNYLPLPLYLKLETNRDRRGKLFIRFKKSKKNLPSLLHIDETLVRWLGLFLAEGWYHQTQVCFSIGKRETSLIEEIHSAAERLFNDRPKMDQNGTSVELSLMNKLLVCIHRDIFGIKQGAKKKEVPPQILSLSPELTKTFLNAYFAGDGSMFYASRKIPSLVISASTASRALATGLLFMLSKCGSRATLAEVERPANSLPRHVRPKRASYRQFIIRVQGEDALNLNLDLLGNKSSVTHETGRGYGRGIPIHKRVPSIIVQPEDVPRNSKDEHGPVYQLSKKSYFAKDSLAPTSELLIRFYGGDIYFAKVIHIREEPYDGNFYDFEVEKTHNFMHGSGIFSHNCIPEFIVSSRGWGKRFADAGLPCVGDDIKSQVGATILHRTLAKLLIDRGVKLDESYQLNIGGNTDFANMLEEERLSSKRVSKTEAVSSQVPYEVPLRIGPSDYVPFLKDNKICYIHMKGRKFGDVPLTLDVKLSVEDSPNSAGVVIDAIRAVKIALDRGIGGPLVGVSAYFFKHPPTQMSDEEARQAVEDFIAGRRER